MLQRCTSHGFRWKEANVEIGILSKFVQSWFDLGLNATWKNQIINFNFINTDKYGTILLLSYKESKAYSH